MDARPRACGAPRQRGAGPVRAGHLAWTLALLVLASTGARGEGAGCGGNTGSFAEVVEGSRGRGPVTARPGTLCADIETRQPSINGIDLHVLPPGTGAGEGGAGQQGFRRR